MSGDGELEAKVIRTVLGDIAPGRLGVCYAHEHVIIDSAFVSERFPEFALNSVEQAVIELRQFAADGGGAMVDSMPCGCGRNVHKLAEVSRQTGVHILAPTGLHLPVYYPDRHWGNSMESGELAARFIADIVEGIDACDYTGLVLQRTSHRAGLIKIATGAEGLEPRACRIFAAAALAHLETGAPILTHTEQGRGGMEQISFLRDRGVPPSKVILSHTDRVADPAYHRKLLLTGVNLEYDSIFRWKGDGNPTLDLLVELFSEFPNQLMLGMDAARRSYWRAYGGQPGLSFLLVDFRKSMEERGLGDEAWNRIMVANPARAYAMRARAPVAGAR